VDVFTKGNKEKIEKKGRNYFNRFIDKCNAPTILAVSGNPITYGRIMDFLEKQDTFSINRQKPEIDGKIAIIGYEISSIPQILINSGSTFAIMDAIDYQEMIQLNEKLNGLTKATELTIGDSKLAVVIRMFDQTFAFRRRIKEVRDGVLEFEKIMRTEKLIRIANDYPKITKDMGLIPNGQRLSKYDGIFDFENETELIETANNALFYLQENWTDVAICSIPNPIWNEGISTLYSVLDSGLVLVEKQTASRSNQKNRRCLI